MKASWQSKRRTEVKLTLEDGGVIVYQCEIQGKQLVSWESCLTQSGSLETFTEAEGVRWNLAVIRFLLDTGTATYCTSELARASGLE